MYLQSMKKFFLHVYASENLFDFQEFTKCIHHEIPIWSENNEIKIKNTKKILKFLFILNNCRNYELRLINQTFIIDT